MGCETGKLTEERECSGIAIASIHWTWEKAWRPILIDPDGKPVIIVKQIKIWHRREQLWFHLVLKIKSF